MDIKNKRILVVSNEAFNHSSSNGRTLMNLLKNISKEYLAQFYIHGVPDKEFCSAYYCNSDQDALNAFIHKKKKNVASDLKACYKNDFKQPRRNLRNLVLRDIIWRSLCWWKADFDDFLNEFQPQVVLLQAGDAPFMFAVARKISGKYNAKLIMFNTESYVLKKRLYASIKNQKFWYNLLMHSLKRQYKKFMEKMNYCVYSMEALEEAYQKKYPHPGRSCTLYTASEIKTLQDKSGDVFSILYCGNLGVGRDMPLDELAKALYEVDQTAVLEVYGKFVNEESKRRICDNPNVKYNGFVDYAEIPDLMSKASMLVHCENKERLENLKYAFSTKIADCIASTRPFLVYATREYPFVEYLEKNKCAHIASDYNELKMILKRCIIDSEYRNRYVSNAKITAFYNHNLQKNCQQMCEIIEDISK